ncbi:hypothetical protein [Actinomadura sp. HBU206391]|uniref:hypothetical protein n=1 Tax=Actinomadura sp. HBU206391 TaxID=2731692 RepID=UPI0016504D07|nr:hypothetical protein [Actinomadura sp. HBU206391]MBC6458500.1 hypothetical protein [Actinomadura sp. HBU206391]
MLINGYDDDSLVAGEHLLSHPGFWAAYLMWLTGKDDEFEKPDEEWFGADAADAGAAYEALNDEENWPVFRVPFGGGHTAVVVQRNFPDDWGTEYFITHPDWGRLGYLATIDGHQAGPGLSWQELIHIANTPGPSGEGVHEPSARLLLLLPALGDADLPTNAVATIASALIAAGAPAATAPRTAELLLDNPMWEPAHWAVPGESPLSGAEPPFADILLCDGVMSPRCGMRLAQGITRTQSDHLAQALGTWKA